MSGIKDLNAIQTVVTTSGSTTKPAFIVVIYDPSMPAKSQFRTILASRVDHTAAAADISGFDITAKSKEVIVKLKTTNKYADAFELAKKVSEELEILQIPWHSVIRIKKITFNLK